MYVVYVQATGPRCPTEGAPQVSPTSKRLPPPPPAQCVSPNLTPASAASLVWHNYKVRVVALKLIFEKTPMLVGLGWGELRVLDHRQGGLFKINF